MESKENRLTENLLRSSVVSFFRNLIKFRELYLDGKKLKVLSGSLRELKNLENTKEFFENSPNFSESYGGPSRNLP